MILCIEYIHAYKKASGWQLYHICAEGCSRAARRIGGLYVSDSNFDYNDVIIGAIAFQITSLTIVFSAVYLDTDKRKQQSSASLAFVRGIHRWIPPTNGQ